MSPLHQSQWSSTANRKTQSQK